MTQYDIMDGLPRRARPVIGAIDAPAGRSPRSDGGAEPGVEQTIPNVSAPFLLLFVFSLLIPLRFSIGETVFSVDRIYLLIAFIPLFLRLVSGAVGRVTLVDVLVFCHCLWFFPSMYVNHGTGNLVFASISTVEFFGGYMVGRVMIYDAARYKAFFKYFFYGLIFLTPLVFIEMSTGKMILNDVIREFASTYRSIEDTRFGLKRAQGPFQHSILFGIFCSIGIANFYYMSRSEPRSGALRTILAGLMSLTALSSGAWLSTAAQIGMIVWDRMTRSNWLFLFVSVACVYVFLSIFSNRGPIVLAFETISFNAHNAWYRVNIWEYGKINVFNNPLFGLGLRDWARPGWMISATVDNFWLLTAMRYGFVGFGFLAAAWVLNIVRLMRARPASQILKDYRTGHVIVLFAVMLALTTVHIWAAPSIFLAAYLGAGSWMWRR